jgi:transcriptional regulator with XRE-family HTH domain
MSAKFGDRMMQARKEKDFSREELADKIGTSGPIVGRYERGDMMPSVDIAARIAEALEVSLDFLTGKSSLIAKDKNMVERLEDIAKLPVAKQAELINVMDAYLRDYNTSKSYKKNS